MRTACFLSDEQTKMEICCDEVEDRGLASPQDNMQSVAQSITLENEGSKQSGIKDEACCNQEHLNCRCQQVHSESEMPSTVDNDCSIDVIKNTECDEEFNVLQNPSVSSLSHSVQAKSAVVDDVDNARAIDGVHLVGDAVITDDKAVNALCLSAVGNTLDSSDCLLVSGGLDVTEHFPGVAEQALADSTSKMNVDESGSGCSDSMDFTQSKSFIEKSDTVIVDSEKSVRESDGVINTLPDVPIGTSSMNCFESNSLIDVGAETSVSVAVDSRVTCMEVSCPEGAGETDASSGMSVELAVDDLVSPGDQSLIMEQSILQMQNTPVIKLEDKCDDDTAIHALQEANDEEARRKGSRVRFHEHHVVTSYLEPPSPWRDG
jgi:hypothetical protein